MLEVVGQQDVGWNALLMMNMNSDLFLVHRSAQGEQRFAVRLKLGDQLLGRSAENDIVYLDDTISRTHARLSVAPSGVVVADLDSRNGTWVNHKRVTCVSVFPGEVIQFGSVAMFITRNPAAIDGTAETEETREAWGSERGVESTAVPVELSAAPARVLELLKLGYMEKQVADELKLSVHTVHNHIRKIYRAYGVSTRIELLLKLLPRS